MRHFFIILMAATLLGSQLTSCGDNGIGCLRGNGPSTTETRDIKDFTQVHIQVNAEVYLIEDTLYKVEINGPESLLSNVISTVNNGQLLMRERRCVSGRSKLIIRIYAPSISDVTLDGSGDITFTKKNTGVLSSSAFKVNGSGNVFVNGTVHADNVYTKVNGSGDIQLNTEAKWVSSSVVGSGNIELSGNAATCETDITGSGDVHTFELSCVDVYTDISGSGKIECRASESLDASISGSGTVAYKGWPKINTRISGSGKVVSEN
jgi:hypothetical protein